MSSSEPALRVEGLSASWGRVPVLRDVSFRVAAGEMLVVMGPNGSGKSTLLRCLAGLERVDHGRIWVDGEDRTGTPAHRRGIALLLQDAVLFPGRSVEENVAYAPLLQRRPRLEVAREVADLLRLVGLDGFGPRAPDTLSGGERQRVALARTLAARPGVVLLDEPYASIDVERRGELRADFRRLLRERGIAAVHVTHDREEGLFLGDRVALLFGGRLAALDTPDRVFRAPPSATAAQFLGYNLATGAGGPLAVHPADVSLGVGPGPGPSARVVASGTVGRGALVVLRSDSGDRWEALLPPDAALPASGEVVRLTWSRAVRLPPGP